MTSRRYAYLTSHFRQWTASGIFGRGALSFLIATAGVNISNFLFHVVISRLLGPSHYGEVGSILSVLSVLTVPLGAAQLAVTQAVMSDERGSPPSLRQVCRRALTAGIVVLAVFSSLIPIFDSFLHLNSPVPLLLTALWIPLATVGAVLQGALIGEFRFRTVAFATFFGGGLIRLLLGAGMVEAGTGVDGAILATVIAQIFITGALAISAREQLVKEGSSHSLHTRARDMTLSVTALSCYTALIGVDTFLARHFFASRQAGFYAAGAVAAHIALFVPGALVTVVFPHLVDGRGIDAQTRKIFARALELTVVVGIIVASGLTLFAHLVVTILFGSTYVASTSVVGLLSFASSAVGVISLFVFLNLARRSVSALMPFAGLILAIVLISIHHDDLKSVAETILFVSLITMILTALPGLRSFAMASANERGNASPQFAYSVPSIDMTIVVPFYNPGPRLRSHVEEIIEVFADSGLTFEVLAVSDGSTDESELSLAGLSPESLSLVLLGENQGKGAALRLGLLQGRGKYLGFIDGDGDIPARVFENILKAIKDNEDLDVIYGSKRHKDSSVYYPPLRRAYSWIYQQMNRVLFQLPLRDTQTGIKVFRREVLLDILPYTVEKRFAFDLELFVVARKLGYGDFLEVPVEIRQRFSSTISPRSIRNMLQDTLAIAYRSTILRYYDRKKIATESRILDDSHAQANGESDAHANMSGVNTKESLQILFLNWRDLAHPKAGGAEIYADQVTRAWARDGHKVTLFCASVPNSPADEIKEGVRIVRRGSRYSVYREAKTFYKNEGTGKFDLVVDVINTRPFFAHKWATNSEVLAIIHQVCRELWRYQFRRPMSWIGRYVLEPRWIRSYKNVTTVTLTESNTETLRSLGLSHVVVVPEGHTKLEKVPTRNPEGTPTILFVGRLEKHKRPQDVVQAFNIFQLGYPDAQLWFIGSGPMESKLKKGSPRNVTFFGRVSDEEKFNRMSRAHVLVATSVREGWGLVVTEAAEVGLRTIAYDVPGLRDSVNASNGILTEGNPASLAKELAEYFRMTEWAAGSSDVRPGGVVSWDQVASEILAAAEASQHRCNQTGSVDSKPYKDASPSK